jgi:nicotinamidase-related amidase
MTLGSAGWLADSQPYPWPWDARFRGARCALLVIDTDEPALPEHDPAWAVTAKLADLVRGAGGLIISVGTARPPRLTHPPIGATPSATALPRPGRPQPDRSVSASGWDGFFGTGLDELLRSGKRDLLLLSGGWLEVGVHSTMRSANDRGYECLLIPDACIAIDAVTQAATISSTEMSGGIFGAVSSSAELTSLLAQSFEESST